ncbi:MAG TPA: hypothetical protein VHD63_26795, partial [Ktedonobacteraceae bacterium]|nr:hypothetical protein [Ktedonobacteraceae bacterium]
GGGSDDLFLTSLTEMKSTGTTLNGDATTLSGDMDYFWSTFESARSTLPPCIQHILSQFETKQKKLYATQIQNRQRLAKALGDSTTLIEAVDKCCETSFTDLTLANVSLTNLLPGQ